MADNRKNGFLAVWEDHPDNPLIEPPWPEFLLGDPTCVTPGTSPDGNWHMLANTLTGIYRFTSPDGLAWRKVGRVCGGMRPYIFLQDGEYHLFYEQFGVPMLRSHVALRTSRDLRHWSEPRVVLEPELDWERKLGHTCGNPCVLVVEGGYRMYYSASLVFFRDLGFCEPLYIGVAHADSLAGPYEKLPEPIISPSPDAPYRNRGAGAIKVVFDEERGLYYGFNNGMYTDAEGRSRSAVLLLSSTDGLSFEPVYDEPIVAPGGDGWKKALVYQLDVTRVGDEWWMYYNARSGWRIGKERIGLAINRPT